MDSTIIEITCTKCGKNVTKPQLEGFNNGEEFGCDKDKCPVKFQLPNNTEDMIKTNEQSDDFYNNEDYNNYFEQ